MYFRHLGIFKWLITSIASLPRGCHFKIKNKLIFDWNCRVRYLAFVGVITVWLSASIEYHTAPPFFCSLFLFDFPSLVSFCVAFGLVVVILPELLWCCYVVYFIYYYFCSRVRVKHWLKRPDLDANIYIQIESNGSQPSSHCNDRKFQERWGHEQIVWHVRCRWQQHLGKCERNHLPQTILRNAHCML